MEDLQSETRCESDTPEVGRMQKAKRKLLAKIRLIGRSASEGGLEEMTARGKPGKAHCAFPPALEIAGRFPHSLRPAPATVPHNKTNQ